MLLRTAVVFGLVFFTSFAGAKDSVGEVIFAIGDAKISDSVGNHAAVKGSKIEAGQTLSTGESGHIHIRFVDNAFVSVRPRSTLLIDTYAFNPAKPAESFVKFTLQTGTARSITGIAGKVAKENFRLNTPVAAIGVRGTDFVVQTTAETTRVSVSEGAIAMSPLTDDCRADGFGPCQTSLARQLTSATANAYLELRSRAAAPVLQSIDIDAPNRTSPARPEEPRANVPEKNVKTGASSTEAISEVVASAAVQHATPPAVVPTPAPVVPPVAVQPPVVVPPVVVQPPAAEPPPPVVVQPPVVVVVPPVVEAPPPAARIWWGRWSDYASPGSAGSIAAVSSPSREIAVSNPVFGLYVEKNSATDLPATGVVGFKLADYEAYRQEGKTLLPATVANPILTMDFGKRTFDTSLVWAQGGQSDTIHAAGKITWQGFLISDASLSNAEVVGALAGSSSQAGYLFSKPLLNSIAVGATRWIH